MNAGSHVDSASALDSGVVGAHRPASDEARQAYQHTMQQSINHYHQDLDERILTLRGHLEKLKKMKCDVLGVIGECGPDQTETINFAVNSMNEYIHNHNVMVTTSLDQLGTVAAAFSEATFPCRPANELERLRLELLDETG